MPSHRDTARQFPWDRVPVVAGVTYQTNGAAPAGGITVLGTFTIPAGKAGTIDNLSIAVLTNGAAAGTYAIFYMDWTDGVTNAILLACAISGATALSTAYANVGQSGWIRPGQQVRLLVNNIVAGATFAVQMGIKITECQP